MAEGLDSAADLFRQEIAPGSDRPRDDSGRFSSVSQRPEPLFEPRPLEGDEKTGDTRDAGDDERLRRSRGESQMAGLRKGTPTSSTAYRTNPRGPGTPPPMATPRTMAKSPMKATPRMAMPKGNPTKTPRAGR